MRALLRKPLVFLLLGGLGLGALLGAFLLPRLGNSATVPPAEVAATNPMPSSLTIDRPEWDFGIVPSDKRALSHTFTLNNNGTEPLQLRVARIGCNCVTVACPDTIAAQATAPLRVEVEVRSREGPFATRVILTTSDPRQPTLDIALTFYGQPRIDIDPPVLQLADVARGQVLERDIQITTRTEPDQESSPQPEITISTKGIECQFLETRPLGTGLRDGLSRTAHRYHLRLDTRGLAPGGPVDGPVRLANALQVRMPGIVREASVALPIEITFRHHSRLTGQTSVTLRRGAPAAEVRVRLRSHDGAPFTLDRVTSSLPEVAAKPAGTTPAAVQDVMLAVVPVAAPKAGEISKGSLNIFLVGDTEEPYRLDVLVVP